MIFPTALFYLLFFDSNDAQTQQCLGLRSVRLGSRLQLVVKVRFSGLVVLGLGLVGLVLGLAGDINPVTIQIAQRQFIRRPNEYHLLVIQP